MAEILFLAHRLPFPPDKGDKIRSFHILRRLAAHHRIRLGTFVDDPDDRDRVRHLAPLCAELCVRPLRRAHRLGRALRGLVANEPLSVALYADPVMQAWVDERLERCDLALAFSGQSARFFLRARSSTPWLLDLVDCDSEKWRALAARARGPRRRLFAREAERLLAFERRAVAAAARTFLVTRSEADLLAERAPEIAARLWVLENGVDAAFFDPAVVRPDPWGEPGPPRLLFTGVMDYPPNVEAVCWFAREVLPALRARFGRVRFAIVGARPARAVTRLADPPDLLVTGRVEDVRGWLRHADVAVAPLWLARGVPNKVLEAMAMARPVIVTPGAAAALHARPGEELLVGADARGFVEAITGLFTDRARAAALGAAARAHVLRWHDWNVTLAPLDAAIAALAAPRSRAHGSPT
ncbi:MAG: TIGR03087 family PEP-CTERM/XrtA system glycosyltransferase [Geminicoccaceae bacterium]|nr:TIGR03087 family PEP-CTERM/XrtA system glycosyltransferase [Geminicoccaceae bacterium]MDW8340302.1 TIGR03087 family PEP-CTERM/XrtA system glycosyltransferase [Geminicoccaceae bacterium]